MGGRPGAGEGAAADGTDDERRGIDGGELGPFREREADRAGERLAGGTVGGIDLENGGRNGVRCGVVHDDQASDVVAVDELVVGDGEQVADRAGELVVPTRVATDEAAFEDR